MSRAKKVQRKQSKATNLLKKKIVLIRCWITHLTWLMKLPCLLLRLKIAIFWQLREKEGLEKWGPLSSSYYYKEKEKPNDPLNQTYTSKVRKEIAVFAVISDYFDSSSAPSFSSDHNDSSKEEYLPRIYKRTVLFLWKACTYNDSWFSSSHWPHKLNTCCTFFKNWHWYAATMHWVRLTISVPVHSFFVLPIFHSHVVDLFQVLYNHIVKNVLNTPDL